MFLQILQFQIADFLQSVYLCSPLYIHKSFLYTCFLKRSDYIEQNKIKISYRKNESWIILSQIEQSIKSKIESIGIPLKDWDISINYGIKTGYNDAFIIDTKKREEILNNCQTTNERTRTDELIRPILRGRDIKRYSYEFADLYLICTFPSKHYNIDKYPAIRDYLLTFDKRKLEQSGAKAIDGIIGNNARKKTNNQWFETQDSIAYWDDFSKPKIVWADIATEPNFVQIDERIYFNNTCYMMVGAPNWFVDYLNSDLVKWYFPLTATDLGEKGTRYFKQFVEKIPIPTAFIGNIQSFFKLTDDEMNCISSSVNFNS